MIFTRTSTLFLLAAFLLSAADQPAFPTPNAAMAALISAVRAGATSKVFTILGPELEALHAKRDKTQESIDRQIFLDGSRVLKFEKQADDPNTVIAYLGKLEWPFPAPLVKTSAGWKFDGKAGVEEIRDRQIGRNELAAMVICQVYLDVQMEYFSSDRKGDGYLQFAQKINSTPGKFDGLYWSNANGEEASPVGPFAAQAEAGSSDKPDPLHGYVLKVLTAQGDAAPGGARSYLVDGRMLTGFALVAWPADYGVSGAYTFIINQLGTIYQKDLGQDTDRLAREIKDYNPDSTWTKVE